MSKVSANMSMSLDGFISGPNDSVEHLHEWLYGLASWREQHGQTGGEENKDAEVLEEAFKNTGAVVMGRRLFDIAEVPWGDNPPFHTPVFVVTHRERKKVVKDGGTTFTFVTDGIESALRQAKAAAGGKDVSIGGGANVIQQYLRAGLLDEIQIHLAPVLLGDGRRLFDQTGPTPITLERTRVIASSGITHLRFRVVK
jgi:dihydrofolate reductase